MQILSEIELVKPALYRFPQIPGSPKHWSWVMMGDLRSMLGKTQEQRYLLPREVFMNFGALSKDMHFLGAIVNSRFENWQLSNLIIVTQSMPLDRAENIFVPAEWAEQVIKAKSEGYVMVQLEEHPIDSDTDMQPNWLYAYPGQDSWHWIAVGYKG